MKLLLLLYILLISFNYCYGQIPIPMGLKQDQYVTVFEENRIVINKLSKNKIKLKVTSNIEYIDQPLGHRHPYLEISSSNIYNYKIYKNELGFLLKDSAVNATVLDSALFNFCTFENFKFSKVQFDSYIEFYNCYFDNIGTFSNSIFKSDAIFNDNHFGNKYVFESSVFKKGAVFDGSVFEDGLHLFNTNFDEVVSFNNSVFNERISLIDINFHKPPLFQNIELPKEILLSNVSFDYSNIVDFNNKIDLSHSSLHRIRRITKDPSRKCVLRIKDADISYFLLPFDMFVIDFDSNTSYETKVRSFEAIIKSCRDAGLLESAKGWDIEYRKLQNVHRFTTLGPFINWFNEIWWNFGHDKWLILVIWLPLFFLFFWLVNFYRIEWLWNTMYKDTELGSNFPTISPDFIQGKNLLAFSFFYTAVIYFGFKLRHESINYNNTLGLVYLYFIYAVGTIHMAFAFSYILSAY